MARVLGRASGILVMPLFPGTGRSGLGPVPLIKGIIVDGLIPLNFGN